MRRILLLGALVVASAPSLAAQRRAVTREDVLNLKAVSAPAVSPAGAQILYTVRQWAPSPRDQARLEARTQIWRVPAGGGPARQLTFGDRADTQPQWSPDGRHISFISARGEGEDEPRPQLYVMRSDGGEPWRLTEGKEGVRSYSWSPDSQRIAYVTLDPRTSDQEAAAKRRDDERVFEGDVRHAHLWSVDLLSRATARVTEGTDFTIVGDASWSPDGTRLVFSAKPTDMLRDNRSDVYVVARDTRAIERITNNPGPDTEPRWSPDGARIAFASELNPGDAIADGTRPSVIGLRRLTLYEVTNRTLTDASRPDFDLEMGTPEWTSDSRRVLFLSGARAYREVFSYDLSTREYSQLTREKTIQAFSKSKDGSVTALAMDSPTAPTELYVSDAAFGNLREVTSTNPQARELSLGQTEVISWKSPDGVEVEGVLLKPVEYRAGQRYPLLVVAHGGPAGAHVNGYRVGGLEGGQVLASQGWAVFYPNPRGSTNYGEAFLRANINDWGGGDFRDIMTGVDALVERGIADPDRLAHIGWSYGGYMTAWVITQTNRFKAAMVGAGLTNLVSMYGTNDIPSALISYFGGVPTPSTLPLYMQRSAISHVDKVTTPTLILHGASDERVPVGQAQELFRALKDRGKVTELVLYPREGHGIQEYHHQKDRLERIHAWLAKYTLGDASRKTTSR